MKKLLIATALLLSSLSISSECTICPQYYNQGQYTYLRIYNNTYNTVSCRMWSDYFSYTFTIYPGTPSPTVPITAAGYQWFYDCKVLM